MLPRSAVLFLLLALSCAHVPASKSTLDSVDALVPQTLRTTATPGAVVAVVSGGNVVYLKAFGVSSQETRTPMRPDTVFRIASLTKSFTGLATAILADRGAVKMDAPIGDFATGLAPATSSLTLSQLLSHSAGVRDEGARPGPRDPAALSAAARRLTESDLFTTPGDIYSYSNLGFTLAGFALEAAAQRPYAEVVTSEILQPLGMKTSTFDSAMAMTYPLAVGHAPGSEGGEPAVLRPYWDNGEALARGGMFSTAPDLARFAIAVMNDGSIDGAQAIPANAVRNATSSRAEVPGQPVPTAYGLGFRIDSYRGLRQVGHFGGGMGFGAVLRMLPEKNIAVIVVANRTNALLNDVADAAFDAIAFEGTSTPALIAPALSALASAEAAEYAGRYRNGGETIELVLQEGALFLKDDATLFPISRSGADFVALADGSAVLRFTLVQSRSGHWYLMTFGRAFRRQ